MTGRPLVPAACRAALREVLHGRVAAEAARDLQDPAQRHVVECAFCSARVRAGARLADALAERPEAPEELSSPRLLAGIHESVVEAAETGPMGELLHRAAVPMPEASEQPRLEQVFAADGFASRTRRRLADELHARPEEPEEKIWSAVQSSILHEVAAQARFAPMRWPLVVAGLAASVFLAVLVVHIAGGSNGTPEQVPIVFTELDQPPDVEFAVLRYGSSR